MAAGAARGAGPVVGWGSDASGQATPPPSVDGTSGTATGISAGPYDSCAIQAGTGAVVCWGLISVTPPPSVDGTGGTASAVALGIRPSGPSHGSAPETGPPIA